MSHVPEGYTICGEEAKLQAALGKRTEMAYQRSGTVPIFAEALRSENGTVPFTPTGGMPPNWE
ncbi:MAG: hypothetical protein H8E44_17220 [Planctomycetes bacterium]|nr:hypothetical protein [Planctomycetota bacterium]MBL7041287.1 hypothetical protein [Pirellulaceae bacterium]